MMWTFEYDTNRVGKHIKEKEFMKYSKYIGSAYAFIFALIFDISKYDSWSRCSEVFNKSLYQLLAEMAHHAHLLHVVRDRDIDEKKGYINYPAKYVDYKLYHKKIISKASFYFNYIKNNNTIAKIENIFVRMVFYIYYKKFANYAIYKQNSYK